MFKTPNPIATWYHAMRATAISTFNLFITLEPPVRGVELEHVDHVVDGDEGVVDGHDGGALGDGRAKHQATDATETVDADLKH